MTSTSAISSAASQADNTAASVTSTAALGNENTFLQLLVAQIQNQDPTQPVDSSTFLSQLAEFSQLEQLVSIQQDVSELDPASAATTAAGASSSTNPTNSTNQTAL